VDDAPPDESCHRWNRRYLKVEADEFTDILVAARLVGR
jgi:hypothetical protein